MYQQEAGAVDQQVRGVPRFGVDAVSHSGVANEGWSAESSGDECLPLHVGAAELCGRIGEVHRSGKVHGVAPVVLSLPRISRQSRYRGFSQPLGLGGRVRRYCRSLLSQMIRTQSTQV